MIAQNVNIAKAYNMRTPRSPSLIFSLVLILYITMTKVSASIINLLLPP